MQNLSETELQQLVLKCVVGLFSTFFGYIIGAIISRRQVQKTEAATYKRRLDAAQKLQEAAIEELNARNARKILEVEAVYKERLAFTNQQLDIAKAELSKALEVKRLVTAVDAFKRDNSPCWQCHSEVAYPATFCGKCGAVTQHGMKQQKKSKKT